MNAESDVLTRYKLDVDKYRRLAETGILHEDSRVELINGELIEMAPIGVDHAGSVDSLTEALVLACAGKASVSVQNSVTIDQFSEPQPDFAISKLRADRYRTSRPGPEDLLLLIEVADSSLRFDRTVKLTLYASRGVAELWIVDLRRQVLEVYRQPGEAGYRTMETFKPGDTVSLALAPDIAIAVNRVFNLD